MRQLPPMVRWILNVVLYILYVMFFSVVFSVLFPLVLQLFWQPVWDIHDPRFAKIQIFIAIFVLLISVVFRKYFYLTAPDSSQKKTLDYTSSTNASQSNTVSYTKDIKDKAWDDIHIYVEKEIK